MREYKQAVQFNYFAAALCFLFLPPIFEMKAEKASNLPKGYRLLYQQDFSKADAIKEFAMTDPDAWKISGTNSSLELAAQSKYTPVVRSPVNIALIADKLFTDFVLEADLLQTSKEYGHRDMCLFFGFQSPTNFYYVHIATATDVHAHNIFIVNGTLRTKISKQTTPGVDWGNGVWHKVRVERTVSDGTIKIYFDDLTKPIMVAEDKTFASWNIGFGSFDGTGRIDNIRIWGPSAKKSKTKFFPHP